MSDTPSRPVDPQLFDWPAHEPTLKASRCLDCGGLAFPASTSCRHCGATHVTQERLPRRGRLWAWTIQRFMPKAPYRTTQTPDTFTPYGLGYVELPGALCIETRLTESDPHKLHIGLEMELVLYPQWLEEDGTAVMNFAFQPIANQSATPSEPRP